MAKQNLTSMSVDALLQLRDEITSTLSRRAGDLKRQLARLGDWGSSGGRTTTRKTSLKGRKVAPKYRGPNGETWAGRGARPRWLQEAMKSGAKPDDFLIAKGAAASRKKTAVKRSRRRKAA
jgi:DNA-binding protein H-NS